MATKPHKRALLRPNPQAVEHKALSIKHKARPKRSYFDVSIGSAQRGLPTQNRSLQRESTGGADALAARKALPASQRRLPGPQPGTIRTENRGNVFGK